MSWSIRASKLPIVRSYARAVEVYNDAVPIPSLNGWRALVNKRDTSKIVCMDEESVVFRYYHTNMVIYHPSEELEVACYDSVNSILFTNRFLPVGLDAISIKGEMWISDRNGNVYYPKPGHRLLFTRTDNVWSVDPKSACEVEHMVLDKRLAAHVRKTLKPYFEWREAVRRLGAKFPPRADPSYFHLIKGMLIKGDIPEAAYPSLAPYLIDIKDMYVLAGAVKKTAMPLGAPPKKSPYEWSHAWNAI